MEGWGLRWAERWKLNPSPSSPGAHHVAGIERGAGGEQRDPACPRAAVRLAREPPSREPDAQARGGDDDEAVRSTVGAPGPWAGAWAGAGRGWAQGSLTTGNGSLAGRLGQGGPPGEDRHAGRQSPTPSLTLELGLWVPRLLKTLLLF